MAGSPTDIEAAFHGGRRRLWGLCYRITGVAADADDVVQEAFVKALRSSAPDAGPDLDRWLVRVATNLAIDCLRRRRRRRYPGSWLPGPVEAPDGPEPATAAADGAAERLERAEDVSYALLIALEALAPRARAVLVLADVLDHSASEIADILETSDGNVRVLLHRARRRLAGFDRSLATTAEARARQRDSLERFAGAMLAEDLDTMREMLCEDVRSITDAGGRYTALHEPLAGRDAVARFHLRTARRRAGVSLVEMRTINGEAALVVTTRPRTPRMAPRLVLRCEIDEAGRIRELHTVLEPRKLGAVRFVDFPGTAPP